MDKHRPSRPPAASTRCGWKRPPCWPARPPPFHGFFNLRPPTLDRPFFTGVLPLGRLGTILDQIELVPREELAWLVNLAVLLQALVLGLAVAALPLLRARLLHDATGMPVTGRQFASVLCYFAGLGVGFLMLEIYLIEKASHYLHDRTFAFGFVLAAMLVFAGAGSWFAQRQRARPQRAVALAVLGVLAWIGLAVAGLDALLAATAGWPLVLRFLVLLAVIAPLAVALGMPMALGLGRFAGPSVAVLPWAWAINGAGSVIATPLANLVMVEFGYTVLLGLAFALYVMVACSQSGSDMMGAFGFFHTGRWGILRVGSRQTGGTAFMKLDRRAVVAGLLAAPAAAKAAPQPWTFEAYSAAMKASGRRQVITAEQWRAAMARKPRMLSTIQCLLAHHFGNADPEIMRAFTEVPREYYHYRYDEKADFAAVAYEEESKPWRIGLGSALSDYRGQAYMTQLCQPKAGERALEVGTGSGFQISILSRIVERAYSIEIIEPLGNAVARSSSRWATTTSRPASATATSAGPRSTAASTS